MLSRATVSLRFGRLETRVVGVKGNFDEKTALLLVVRSAGSFVPTVTKRWMKCPGHGPLDTLLALESSLCLVLLSFLLAV